MKINEKIQADIDARRPFYSFEFFPPKTEAGCANLYARIERMARLHPRFIDVTWGAGGSTADLTMDIVRTTQDLTGLDTMMHLTCTNLPRDAIAKTLDLAREAGIQNLLALRGDPPRGADGWETCADGLSYASELVEFIRARHGDWFSVGVAGYPHAHEEAESLDTDIGWLQHKLALGADFVITQLFYDAASYVQFVEKCRAVGITAPIIPGIMPIHNYRSFRKVTQLCPDIPKEIDVALHGMRNDDAAVRDYGTEVVVDLCQKLLDAGAPGLHFYTLNLEGSVMRILDALKLVPDSVSRTLPWRRSANANRSCKEEVRPIFWANRPHSYLARTNDWDEFPNGRWGDSESPAYGDLNDHHWFHRILPAKRRLRMWGEAPATVDDVSSVFVGYCNGEVGATPFSTSRLALESGRIKDSLVRLNRSGLWTINSQPRIDAAPSEDPAVGWGGAGGYVYQKAYVEFFIDADRLPALLQCFRTHPAVTFHAINARGESYTNWEGTNAVTWGVFPGREVLQPTIVDTLSFVEWKDEAFGLWMSMWGELYEEGTPSRELFERLQRRLFLVNVVDNDYVSGDLWDVLNDFLDREAG